MKSTKRNKEYNKLVDKEKLYDLDEAVGLLKKFSTVKYDETLEVAVMLGVDPRHADQNIRGTVSLPHGTGKTKTVLVLTEGVKEQEAKDAGADFVGLQEYIEKIKGGWTDVDAIIATPDTMRDVGKLGKILGPRGLMPSPKAGTVTMDVAAAVKEIKAGRIEFRVDKKGILHVGLGKVSFDQQKLVENIGTFYQAVLKLRPSSAKGQYVKKLVVTSTMGPGLKINHQEIAEKLK